MAFNAVDSTSATYTQPIRQSGEQKGRMVNNLSRVPKRFSTFIRPDLVVERWGGQNVKGGQGFHLRAFPIICLFMALLLQLTTKVETHRRRKMGPEKCFGVLK